MARRSSPASTSSGWPRRMYAQVSSSETLISESEISDASAVDTSCDALPSDRLQSDARKSPCSTAMIGGTCESSGISLQCSVVASPATISNQVASTTATLSSFARRRTRRVAGLARRPSPEGTRQCVASSSETASLPPSAATV